MRRFELKLAVKLPCHASVHSKYLLSRDTVHCYHGIEHMPGVVHRFANTIAGVGRCAVECPM